MDSQGRQVSLSPLTSAFTFTFRLDILLLYNMGVFKFKSVSGGEKEVSPTPSQGDEQGLYFQREWKHEEEKEEKRKLEMIIMNILTFGFL